MIVDLYSGARGWDEGARLLGIDGIVGVELDEWACRTSVAAGHPVIRADVERYPAGHLAGRVDVLIESPPCQTFSTAGKGAGRVIETELRAAVADAVAGRRNLGAHRRAMVRTLAAAMPRKTVRSARMQARRTPGQPRWVETEPWTRAERTAEAQAQVRGATQVVVAARWIYDVRPRAIALEQVPAVLPLWQAMRPGLERLGYSVAVGLLSSEQYGVPQTRRRAFLVASLDRVARLPKPTHRAYDRALPDGGRWGQDGALFGDGLLPWVSMADALGWGMTARPSVAVIGGSSRTGAPAPLDGGSGARATLAAEQEAHRWLYRNGNMPNSAERTTIAGDPRVFQPGGHHEPGEQSENAIRVSVADALTLQSFRPDYPLQGPRSRQFLQVGNAVPPLMAAAVLGELLGIDWRRRLWSGQVSA